MSDPQEPQDDFLEAADSAGKPSGTAYLNIPASSASMADRQPKPGTAILTEAWRLVFKIGKQTETLPVEDEIYIGRKTEEQDIIKFDLTPYGAYQFGISRQHAVISLHDGLLYLEDLESTNGTRINGSQLTPRRKYRLRDGDELEFARLRMLVRFEKPER